MARPNEETEVARRMSDLRRRIEEANYQYYVLNQPTMSDSEYDALVRELQELERLHPELASPESPTMSVGPPPATGFRWVTHIEPMLGLSNAYDFEELESWERRIRGMLGVESLDYTAELKIDGLAVALQYEAGKLECAATRGDGIRGEDVTANIKTIPSVPHHIPNYHPAVDGIVEVKCEVYMPRRGFHRLNEERQKAGLPAFANPRNAAAGSVRQQDPSVTASRPLDIFAFGISRARELGFRTQWEVLECLSGWGFPVNPHNELIGDLGNLKSYCATWQSKRERLDYDADGVVVKVNDLLFQERLGAIFRAPRWAVAYKFPPVEATTRVSSIFLVVGREGAIIPYAVVDPVRVGGATLSVIPLHNEDYIRKKDIRIGDRVIVRRAGDIRPQIVKSLPELRTGQEHIFEWPSECPACGTRISRPKGQAAWFCPNPDCPGKLFQRVKQFVSEEAMDIRGIGDALVGELVESGRIVDVGDIYYLTAEDLTSLGLKRRKAENLIRAIDESKSRPLHRLIFGLGIPDVGAALAVTLASRFGSLERLQSAREEELMAVEGIGKKTALGIRRFFESEGNLRMLEKLRRAGVRTSGP